MEGSKEQYMYEINSGGKYQPVVIGIDHGFSLIKTYHHIMSNGVAKTSGSFIRIRQAL